MLATSRTLVGAEDSAARLIVFLLSPTRGRGRVRGLQMPYVAPSPNLSPLRGRGGRERERRRGSALLGAVARRDLLLGRVLGGDVLDQRRQDRIVAGVPVGDHLPLLAVPLVDAAEPCALMVAARDLDRSDHALEAELLDAV